MKNHRFAVYSGFVLFYNVAVIVWGAFVRATGSGAGCGSHWPTCNGQVIPRAPQIETIIEFIHRASSGLTLVLVAILVILTWRIFDKKSMVRKSAAAALLFVLLEAALGAGLVLFGWTAENNSVGRAIMMMVHLANTFLLLASLTLTWLWSAGGAPTGIKIQSRKAWLLVFSLVGILILGASGAITALGDTLFPATSVLQGMQAEFSGAAHFLLRLRVFHPVIAVLAGVLVYIAALPYTKDQSNRSATKTAWLAVALFVLQFCLGGLNVILLAPVWLQLVHLLFSNLVWIVQVALTSFVIGSPDLFPGIPDHPVHDRINAVAR
ncbi:MAG TPA: COX15/CtaA family protein [Longilinea sp.]|nr:COX15/CtaA family protein [Longilinea sp.]